MKSSGSVNKTFDLLELVLNSNGTPVTPLKAAQKLELNASTCVRLFKSLVQRGYIVHKSRKEGYVPGPAAFSLNNSGGFYAALAKISEKIVRDIALKVGRLVLVCVYCKGQKFIMNYFDGSPHPRRLNNAYNDFYATVSGRVLLAHQDETEIAAYVKNNGLPGDRWNSVNSKTALFQELSLIKSKEHYFFNEDGKYWCIAMPVLMPGNPCLTLSTSVIAERSIPETIELFHAAAVEIKEHFNNNESSIC